MLNLTRSLTILSLLALALPVTSQAQYETDADTSTLARKFDEGFHELSSTYWRTRFAGYRKKIDRLLSEKDLAELNELRVRYFLLRETAIDQLAHVRRMEMQPDPLPPETSLAEIPADPSEQAMYDMATTEAEMEFGTDVPDSEATIEEVEPEDQVRENSYAVRQIESELSLLDDRLAGRVYFARPYANPGTSPNRFDLDHTVRELTEAKSVANWIVRNYGPGIDKLYEEFESDFRTFREVVKTYVGKFLRQNRSALKKDPVALSMLHRALSIGNDIPSANSTLVYEQDIREEAEASLLLYYGQDPDLANLVGYERGFYDRQFPVASRPSLLGPLSTAAASSRATISFTLKKPATSIEIRIIDSRGRVVGTFDQGKRNAGSHTAAVEIASLPAGSYLCQLRIVTATGEELHARGIQVTR